MKTRCAPSALTVSLLTREKLTSTTGFYYDTKSKFFVDASFVPNNFKIQTLEHRNNATFVVQVAYRHQSLIELREEVELKAFSPNLQIQLVLGIKIYDDNKFSVILFRRHNRKSSVVLAEVSMISTKVKTDKIITLPADALLWGDDYAKASKDCVLRLETLRSVLRYYGRVKILPW
jgi:hypothetical protein